MIDHNPYRAPMPEEAPHLHHVLYWTWERECMRIAKENGYTGPLTNDSILATYRFCNIRRRDDRVSKWIIENMLIPATYDDDYDIWFIAAIARYINWPPTLAKLLKEGAIPGHVEDFDVDLFSHVVDNITGKAWTGAFMVYPGKKEKNIPKGLSVGRYILLPLQERAAIIREAITIKNSVEALVDSMKDSYGWSTFSAGQVAADLSYVKDFNDVNTWAPMGPGSRRGLNRLLGRPLGTDWTQDEFNERLIEVRGAIRIELEIDDLTLHDVQNVFCEIDKYWRALYGQGAPRNKYVPETSF